MLMNRLQSAANYKVAQKPGTLCFVRPNFVKY